MNISILKNKHENETLCRICLAEGQNMLDLSTQIVINEFQLDYATMMMCCASVQFDVDDSYPKSICSECETKMKTAFMFKITCENSSKKLEENKVELLVTTVLDEEITAPILISDAKVEQPYLYTCEQCNLKFHVLDSYTCHLATHGKYTDTVGSQKLFKCHLCERVFKSLYGLKYHIEHHKGLKQYKCSYDNCTWSFITKQALLKHTATHSDIKNCLCSTCGKAYSTKDALSHHMITHLPIRPHKCIHCGKSYMQRCHLKKHMLVHSGCKLYTCESCGRSYSTNSQLKYHFKKFCGRGIEPVFKFHKSEKIK